jgi:uncharacterized protein (TIGR02271 family)
MFEGSSLNSHIDWNEVLKKRARGINDEDLGEVREVTQDYVLVEKGTLNKEKLYIPRDLATGYDSITLTFNITAEEAKNKFLRDSPPVVSQSQFMEEDATITDDLVIIPVMAERLDVSKNAYSQEAKIIKEPITETKITEVPLVHDELYIETRPVSESELDASTAKGYQTDTSSVQSDIKEEKQEIATLFLRVEEPEVSKHPYLKEEIIFKKKSITETKKISHQLRSEKVHIEGAQEEIKKEDQEDEEGNGRSI